MSNSDMETTTASGAEAQAAPPEPVAAPVRPVRAGYSAKPRAKGRKAAKKETQNAPKRARLFRDPPRELKPLEQPKSVKSEAQAAAAMPEHGARIDAAEASDYRLRRTEAGELQSNFAPPPGLTPTQRAEWISQDPASRARARDRYCDQLAGDAKRRREAGDVGTADRMELQLQFERAGRRSTPTSDAEGQVAVAREATQHDTLQSQIDALDVKYGTRHRDAAQARIDARVAARTPAPDQVAAETPQQSGLESPTPVAEAQPSAPAAGAAAPATAEPKAESYRDKLPPDGQRDYDSLRERIEAKLGRPLDEHGTQVFNAAFDERRAELRERTRAMLESNRATRDRTGDDLASARPNRAKPPIADVAGYEGKRAEDGRSVEYRKREGGRLDFIDRGERISCSKHARQDPAAMRAAVALACERYPDGFTLRGTREFQEAAAREAAAQGKGSLIRNAGLRPLIEAEENRIAEGLAQGAKLQDRAGRANAEQASAARAARTSYSPPPSPMRSVLHAPDPGPSAAEAKAEKSEERYRVVDMPSHSSSHSESRAVVR